MRELRAKIPHIWLCESMAGFENELTFGEDYWLNKVDIGDDCKRCPDRGNGCPGPVKYVKQKARKKRVRED